MSTKEEQYRETAQELASAHRYEDPKTAEVLLIPDGEFVNVRLLEVSGSAPSSGDVFPFHFEARPDLGVKFASTVILLSPDEWKLVQEGKLALPSDWDLKKAEKL